MNKVVILLGPTGVGKTGASILLAKELGTEIISADSMQIYRHMDIGTAKPAPEERALIRHHMIDIADPWESFSTGKYISAVVPVVEYLHRNEKIPIVVGGTGLYIKAMTRGIFSGPSADWKLRQDFLSMEKEKEGSLYNYLKELDPEAALKITPKDIRRIIRAIEVCLKSNIRISDMQKNLTRSLPYNFIKIGITRDRKELYRMIEDRVDEMIKIGLIDEVKRLTNLLKETETRRRRDAEKEKFTDSPNRRFTDSLFPSMQAIGYKEIAMHLNEEISLDEAIMIIKRDTKRYAKRQFTWFRKEEHIQWVDITGVQDTNEVFSRVLDALKTKL
jgi:tRNA dimethylallyltransferase